MKLLADENLDSAIVDWLRQNGHDVTWLAQSAPGTPDGDVTELACAEGRVILSLDRDFGELVFKSGARPPGVVLLRVRACSGDELLSAFQLIWRVIESRLMGSYIVATRRKIRIRPIPR